MERSNPAKHPSSKREITGSSPVAFAIAPSSNGRIFDFESKDARSTRAGASIYGLSLKKELKMKMFWKITGMKIERFRILWFAKPEIIANDNERNNYNIGRWQSIIVPDCKPG